MYPPAPKKMNHDAGRIKVQQMGGQNRKFVRLPNDTESEKGSEAGSLHKSFSFERTTSSVRRGWEKGSSSIKNFGRSLKSPFTRVFAEDLEAVGKRVLDPRSKFVTQWNQFFVMSCLVAVFVDPLFFYLPIVDGVNVCIKIQKKLAIVALYSTLLYQMWLIVLLKLGLRLNSHVKVSNKIVPSPPSNHECYCPINLQSFLLSMYLSFCQHF